MKSESSRIVSASAYRNSICWHSWHLEQVPACLFHCLPSWRAILEELSWRRAGRWTDDAIRWERLGVAINRCSDLSLYSRRMPLVDVDTCSPAACGLANSCETFACIWFADIFSYHEIWWELTFQSNLNISTPSPPIDAAMPTGLLPHALLAQCLPHSSPSPPWPAHHLPPPSTLTFIKTQGCSGSCTRL